jgi:hypothetical protein
MLNDLSSNVTLKRAISPVSVSDTTAQVSQILDTRDMGAVMLAIATGSIADADATFTVLIEESAASDLSGGNAVADADLIGTEVLAAFQFDDDNECRKIGYVGSKRYIRATITPVNNASAAVIAAMWVCTPRRVPAENPPA